MGARTILISQPFALRQQKGVPVYTKIETEIIPHSQEFIEKYGVFEKMGYKLADRKNRIKTDYPLDLHNLERIIITPNGKGYLSTYFLDFMKDFNVPIYFVNGKGMVESCFMPTYFKKPSLIVKQCEARINGKNIEVAKYILTLKLESQGMKQFIPKLMEAKNLDEILYAEAIAAKLYFDQWSFPCRFNWAGRHGRSLNANAVDPVNAILNLGYGLLAQGMSEILLERGFEISIGLMHYSEQNTYWSQLSFDVIEPYRILIDKEVKQMVKNSIFEPDDFVFSKNRSHMVLKDRPFENVLDRFLKVLDPLEKNSLPMIRKIEKML
ncbi:MAG: CRISPR-associated endonuclease Cas1 [Candidatus Methanoperedens sp.]|nr:CRISPR-associated endonuclease Cas1 [Candidatus Methanoperedens sp.]